MNARHLFVATMGTLMGFAGIEHGVGEILQGNVMTHSLMIQSWPDSAFFQSLGGEPAMTILPDLRITGILAILFSLLFVVVTIFFVQRRMGGPVLILLAGLMLLFGAGVFPPILGALVGIAATGLRPKAVIKPISGLGLRLGRAWRWIFAACCLAWLALFPGLAVMGYYFGVDDPRVTLAVMAAAIGLLPLTYWSGAQHDRI